MAKKKEKEKKSSNLFMIFDRSLAASDDKNKSNLH